MKRARALRRSSSSGLLAGLAILAGLAGALADAPKRVVSMNLCTDQFAMLIAAPGQLYSVSHLAHQPQSSVLAEKAALYTVNHGLAEEIFLMKPDLVIAGTFTTRATVEMLRRLGFRVEEFAPSSSFDGIRGNVRRMGALLGREERAEALIAEMDEALADAEAQGVTGAIAALNYTNNFTSGRGTLADDIVTRSGLENLGAKLGLEGTVKLPLEVLIVSAPDVLIGRGRWSKAPALAYEDFSHPAMRALNAEAVAAAVPGKYMICGAPFTVEAVRILAEAAARAGDRGAQ